MILSGKGKGRCLSGQTSFYYCIYSFTESSFGMEQQITWLQLNQSLTANVLKTRQRQLVSSLVVAQLVARRMTVWASSYFSQKL